MKSDLRIGLLIGLCLLHVAAFSQKKEEVLMTVEGEKITLTEFENIYKKNNTNASVDQKSLEEYLELFINFKLKVKEAEAMGLDTVGKFQNELAGYRRQLAQPYLVDKEMTDALVKEAYDRMQYDVAASHILISLKPDASPADTLAAYQKALEYKGQVKTLEEFQELAVRVSDDPSSATNKGNLGYFSAFAMVYPFETAAFTTTVGQMSNPIRTRFGYHLVFVQDKRKARGEIRVAHILVRTDEKGGTEARDAANKKARELYAMVRAGEDFEKVARLNSDDKNSANRGGELPKFGTGRMIESFEDAAFALENDGDVSKPIESPFGFHIIKRLERYQMGSMEAMQNTLKVKIDRDGRNRKSVTSLVGKLKKEYKFKEDAKAYNAFVAKVDSSYFQRKWNMDVAKGMTKPLFTLTDKNYSNTTKSYTQEDFAKHLSRTQRMVKNGNLELELKEQYDAFVSKSVLDFEDGNLEAKYPAFRALMKEYRDGILLFELMDNKVWSKAVTDSTGLAGYHEEHKSEFMWEERLDVAVYLCANQEVAEKAMSMVKEQQKVGFSNDSLLNTLNTDSQFNLRIESGRYEKEDNTLVDAFAWQKGLSEVKAIDGKSVFLLVRDVLEPQPKELNEARGVVTAAYQSFLEEQWIAELRKKYSYEVNREALTKID